jgi:hypothetical protein
MERNLTPRTYAVDQAALIGAKRVIRPPIVAI